MIIKHEGGLMTTVLYYKHTTLLSKSTTTKTFVLNINLKDTDQF